MRKDLRPITRTEKIGGRRYRIRKDEIPVASFCNGEWDVSEYGDWSSGEWRSFKVMDRRINRKDGHGRKRVYQIGFNVSKNIMSRNNDWFRLTSNHTELSLSILEAIRQYTGI